MRVSSHYSFAACSRLALWLLVLGSALPDAAEAGKITAKAKITYCEIEAVDCIASDLQSCQLIFNSALGAGEAIISETGSLCYRRSKTPGDCASEMQASWSCITNFVDAPKKDEIR